MSEAIGCDLLILGSGMAGLTAGARAAEQGAKVVVVEKDTRYGGSAALSGGVLYAVLSPRKMAYFSDGDPALAQVVIETYPRRWPGSEAGV